MEGSSLFLEKNDIEYSCGDQEERSSDIVFHVIFDILGIYCHYADIKIKIKILGISESHTVKAVMWVTLLVLTPTFSSIIKNICHEIVPVTCLDHSSVGDSFARADVASQQTRHARTGRQPPQLPCEAFSGSRHTRKKNGGKGSWPWSNYKSVNCSCGCLEAQAS